MNPALIANLAIGTLLLLLGRNLFWLFVGVAGFLLGMEFAGRVFDGPELTRLIVAILIGVVAAVLAVVFYKVAVAVGGFVVGGYLAVQLMRYLGVSAPQSLDWLPYIIGGVVGAVLVLLIFDWALIVLSSLAGASLIVQSVEIQQLNPSLVFAILAAAGILIQAGIMLRSRQPAA